jgi:hypothetical protein
MVWDQEPFPLPRCCRFSSKNDEWDPRSQFSSTACQRGPRDAGVGAFSGRRPTWRAQAFDGRSRRPSAGTFLAWQCTRASKRHRAGTPHGARPRSSMLAISTRHTRPISRDDVDVPTSVANLEEAMIRDTLADCGGNRRRAELKHQSQLLYTRCSATGWPMTKSANPTSAVRKADTWASWQFHKASSFKYLSLARGMLSRFSRAIDACS